MWRDLSHQWQIVFEEAWKAFGFGSTPIGAALFDREGQLILSDRNRSLIFNQTNDKNVVK